MGYNLKTVRDAASADVEIKDPETGAPTGVLFTLAGPEHPKRKSIELTRQRRLRAALQKTGKLELDDPAEDEQTNIDTITASVLGWSGYEDDAGVPVPFNAANVGEIVADPDHGWLRVQLLAALGERERFIKRSAPA